MNTIKRFLFGMSLFLGGILGWGVWMMANIIAFNASSAGVNAIMELQGAQPVSILWLLLSLIGLCTMAYDLLRKKEPNKMTAEAAHSPGGFLIQLPYPKKLLPNAPWPGPGRKAARPRPCPGWDKIRLPPPGSEAAGHSLPPAPLPLPPYPGSPSRPAAIPHPWPSRSGVLPQFEHHIAHGCRTRNPPRLRLSRPPISLCFQGFSRVLKTN